MAYAYCSLYQQTFDQWLFQSLDFAMRHAMSAKTCANSELKYGGMARLRAHDLGNNACLRTVKTCEDNGAVNYCAQVQFTFKRIDFGLRAIEITQKPKSKP